MLDLNINLFDLIWYIVATAPIHTKSNLTTDLNLVEIEKNLGKID